MAEPTTATQRLPVPELGPAAAAAFVAEHLGDLAGDAAAPSPRFRGGQRAADAALADFDVRGYAARRNEVWPEARRGASALSPYIRHGLLDLPRVWGHVGGGPTRDVSKFRDELLWQEYARHLYARVGSSTARGLRFDPPQPAPWGGGEAWPEDMRCIALAREELERDGWLVNQTRMWLASQWSVRAGARWEEGEDAFFRHLLDGSRAANRLGWQWTVGTATGRPYAFTRWQVDKRAPGLCRTCVHDAACPIADRPATSPAAPRADRDARLKRVTAEASGAGPEQLVRDGVPEAVWITAESLGDADPALAAHPTLPAVFVFDVARLARWQLSAKRLVFLVECLADLATRRPVELLRGSASTALSGRSLAASYTPEPGWRAHAARLQLAEVHPWAWLRRPPLGPIQSFSAWRRGLSDAPVSPRDRAGLSR